MSDFLRGFLMFCCSALGVGILFCLIRAFRGPRFTDRVVAVNMIGTITIAIMAILTVIMDADFLIDVCLTYALLSFIAVVVLTRLVIIRRRGQIERETSKAPEEIDEMETGFDD